VGLKISAFKTKKMRVNPSTDLTLTVSGRKVEQVRSFTYFGSIVTVDGRALEDVHSHIKKANGAFVQLYPIWKNKSILIRTNIRLFNKNVKWIVLCGCETRKINKLISYSFQVFVSQCL
jgi:hypothetical protein